MAPYTPYSQHQQSLRSDFQPEQYEKPGIIDFIYNLPRYGFSKQIGKVLQGDEERSGYVRGIVIASSILLCIFVLWCFILIILKGYCSGWPSGTMHRPIEPEHLIGSKKSRRRSSGGERSRRRRSDDGSDDDEDEERSVGEEDDGTSSTSQSSSGSSSNGSGARGKGGGGGGLSISSAIFFEEPEEELTMAVIAKEQKRDASLQRRMKKRPDDFSTTTNGKLTLITMRGDDDDGDIEDEGLFRVFIPSSLRLKLLRTYHDCLVDPDDVNNPESMIYEYFTWNSIRRDADKYVRKYRKAMRGESSHNSHSVDDSNSFAVTKFRGDGYDSEEEEASTPITLDVIAHEQKADTELAKMMHRAPSVFSTATNGSIQLITARGKDKKYRIVIPKSLQAKVLKTYHDCLVNPTEDNNFEKVLYVHFTWNGIHKDVEDYVLNEGLTEEMKARNGGGGKSRKSKGGRNGAKEEKNTRGGGKHKNNVDTGVSVKSDDAEEDEDEDDMESENSSKPIGLDEIAKEQKKDKELRQLKKEEPFVFSTVRYGNTLLTTAQNFRDNKYRIVIPRSLQGRMLLTYKECLLNPTPDRNFDTLLYNHFTWNGIHDDVDYFVKSNGRIPKKDDCSSTNVIDLVSKKRKKKEKRPENESETRAVNREEMDPEYADWEIANEKFNKKLRRLRIAFLFSGVCLIICSILFFEMGVKTFFKSLEDAQVALQTTEDTANSAIMVTENYLQAQSGIQQTAKTIGTYNSSQWCSAAAGSESALTIRNSTYEIGVQLRDAANRIESEVKEIEQDLEGVVDLVQDAESQLEDMKKYIRAAKYLVIFIDSIVLSLMITCVLSWMGKQNFMSRCVRNAFIMPLFIVLLVMFWVFSTFALMGSLTGSDFCITPDDTTVAVIVKYKETFGSVVFVLLMYYITGCLPERLPEKLESLSVGVSVIGGITHSLVTNLGTAAEKTRLANECGSDEGLNELISLLNVTDASIHAIYDVFFGVRDVLQCQNFNPIYTALVYDAVCTSGIRGLSWVFFTSFAMAIFSMVIITLRAAIHQY